MGRFRRAVGLAKRRPRVSDRALPRIYRVRAERVVTKLYDATSLEDGMCLTRVVLVRPLDRWYSKLRYGRVRWFKCVAWAFNGLIGIFVAAIIIDEVYRLWNVLTG